MIISQVVALRDFPFDSDEANHASGALALYFELREHDWRGALSEFMSQGYYPPGFSLLKAITFLIFGASANVARIFSAMSLLLALLVIYAIALEVDRRYGWLAGLLAVGLTITIQPLLVASTMVLMEAPGLLATFTMLWLTIRAIKQPTRSRLIATSALLLLTFLTKYTYGIIAVMTIVLSEVFIVVVGRLNGKIPEADLLEDFSGEERSSGEGTREDVRFRWLWLFGPFVAGMTIWFINSDNFHSFLAYSTSQPPGAPWLTWENLLVYPRSFVNQFVPSPFFSVLSITALVWAIWKWRVPSLRLILIYFLVGMAVMTINLPKNPRFIVTIVPAIHLLTGLMLSSSVAKLKHDDVKTRLGSGAITILILMGALISIPTIAERIAAYPSLMEVEVETVPEIDSILNWIVAQIPSGEKFFVLNYWDQLSPPSIAWYLGTRDRRGSTVVAYDDVLMPSALVEEATEENIRKLRQEILDSGATYIVLFEGGSWGLPYWPEHFEALQDSLEFVGRQEFMVPYYETYGWQDTELLNRTEWERVKEDSQRTLNIGVIVYRLHR